MKKGHRIFLFVILTFFIIVGAMITYLFVSPKPSVWLVRALFGMTTYKEHAELSTIKENVTIMKDLTYDSHAGMNTYDVIVKTDLMENENVPTILWIHGGAFVAGDKDDVTNYMIVLANEGYAVININYGLGFEYTYPTPLIQIGEAYNHVKKNLEDYPFLDLDNLIVGGDSAGAFLALQFLINNTNPAYQALTKVDAVLTKEQLKGAILYCGSYDFNLLLNLIGNRVENVTRSSSTSGLLGSIVGFFAQNIGHAFLGDKNWSTNPEWEKLSLIQYVTADFPPAFITDAKNISFEAHGKALVYELDQLGVLVEGVFYEAELSHEYQFHLGIEVEDGNNYAMMTLEKVLTFLQKLA